MSAYYRKGIDKLEKVQRRAVRMITDLRGTSYRENLLESGLSVLKKGELEQISFVCFRILEGIDKINSEALFSLFPASSITRGHSMKVVLPRFKTDVRRYFFLPELSVSGIHCLTMQSAVELLPLFKIMLTIVLLSCS